MALVKQTLTLFFISAHIISAIHVDARFAPGLTAGAPAPAADPNQENTAEAYIFAPWPAADAPAPAPVSAACPSQSDTEEADKGSNPSDFPVPDITEIIPDQNDGTPAGVANMVAKQMQAIEKKIDEFNASLKARMDNPNASHGTKECVAECDEVFGAALDDIKNTLDSLDGQNLFKANFDVSAVGTNVDTCNDCFNEMVGGDPEVKKFSDWVLSITGEALEALQNATN